MRTLFMGLGVAATLAAAGSSPVLAQGMPAGGVGGPDVSYYNRMIVDPGYQDYGYASGYRDESTARAEYRGRRGDSIKRRASDDPRAYGRPDRH